MSSFKDSTNYENYINTKIAQDKTITLGAEKSNEFLYGATKLKSEGTLLKKTNNSLLECINNSPNRPSIEVLNNISYFFLVSISALSHQQPSQTAQPPYDIRCC